MSELKWRLENGTYNALAVRHAAGEFRGPMARYADTADLIACLKANPEACAEVLAELNHDVEAGALRIMLAAAERERCHERARAESAERERDEARTMWSVLKEQHAGYCKDLTRLEEERDALKAKLAEADGVVAAVCGAFGIPPTQCYRVPAMVGARELERIGAARKLAEAEREKLRWSGIADHARKMLELAWLELGQDDDHETVSGAIRDLRARLTACEKVVEAARLIRGYAHPDGDAPWKATAELRAHMRAHTPHLEYLIVERLLPALRALAAAQAKDSELSVSVVATAESDECAYGPHVDPRPLCVECGKPWVPPEGFDATVEVCPTCELQFDALEERIVERVARAASVSDRQRYANDVNTHPMSRLADELRRKL